MGFHYRLNYQYVRRAVIAATLMALARAAAAEPAQIGFVNAARSDDGARAVINSLRMGVAHEGYRPLSATVLRGALEDSFKRSVVPTIDAAKSLIDEAKDAYTRFEYEEALERLSRADAILHKLPTEKRILEITADRYRLAGRIFAGKGAQAQAVEQFRVVQRLRPKRRTLDSGTYHPDTVKLYDRARSVKRPRVPFEISVEPAGATIWLDGKRLAPSQRNVKATVGLHRIAAEAEGHRSKVRMIRVGKGTREVSLRLSPAAVADEIRALRAALIAGGGGVDWQNNVVRIAALTGAPVLVVVRDAGEGVFEAAVCRKQSLGAWIPVPSSRFYAALTPASSNSTVVERQHQDSSSNGASWYQTWWGKSLIVGGLAAAAGVTLYAVTRESGLAIDTWCPGSPECEQ